MVIKKVQHYLNPQGVAYFPEWVEKLKKARSSYDGIKMVEGLSLECCPDQTHLIMIFASQQFWMRGFKVMSIKLFYKISNNMP